VRELVLYTISGLTTAGIYAITASGLTLTYATTGVFNFAHGAVGMMAAFVYWQLRFDWGVPAPLAFGIVLLVLAPLAGLVLERVVVRRLQGTSDVTNLVVTAAVLLGLVALALWVWDPHEFRTMRPLWSGRVVEWGIVRVPVNDLAVLAIAAAVAIGLGALLHGTRAGIAMRATVDDPTLATLVGSRPAVNGGLAWAIGTALAALAGILVAPKLSLSPLPITLLVVNAYAAAVIGRLRSLPLTFAGALVLGLLNDLGVGYLPKIDTGQQYLRGLVAVIPVVVLFVALVALPADQLRGTRPVRRRELVPCPTWPGTLALCAVTVAATGVVSTVLGAGDLFSFTKVWGLAIVGLSLVPLVGYAGKLSLCQLGFGAIGAVVVGHLGRDGNPLALVAGALVAGVVGAVVAIPALRLSGIYLALATAAFAVFLDRWIFTLPSFTVLGHRTTIFEDGSLAFARPDVGPLDLTGDRAFLIAGSVVFCLCLCAVVAIRRGPFGRRLLALKDSSAACSTLGIDVRATTLAVFALSAAIAGLGGGVYGMALRSAAATRFDFVTGVTLLLAVVVGGVASVGSALVAGVFLGGPTLANLFPEWSQLTAMTVALAGIGIGNHPEGIVAVLGPRWRPVARAPWVLGGLVAALGGAWALRLAEAIDTAGWAVASVVVLVATPAVAEAVVRRRAGPRPELVVQPEWWGLDEPFRPDQVELLDRELHLPELVARVRGAP
jgi:branched-chain amino acid transport system permease protein